VTGDVRAGCVRGSRATLARNTTVFVQWDATATLLTGDDSYFNRGFHVISMRWGKVYALDVFEDSQEVDRGLAAQAAAGLNEAVAEQIVS
jgi:hypothetical protein